MQVQVDEVIRKAQEEKLVNQAKENDLDLKELDGVLQPIIDSCTKDSISVSKIKLSICILLNILWFLYFLAQLIFAIGKLLSPL